ncbi:cupredoxin domain-containing protein [Undibacter mobilis]|uniref:Copper resistance protein n=1 Tax=Undibacter mobilis TaxID=2292256 RepID=A0A371B917_9BRAD|nr:cupredoxin family protein [Undibacter mobilis]RDV04086.1 copper resistance protein [Undibacter mobilis]
MKSLALSIAAALAITAAGISGAGAHGETYAAGAPGSPKKPSRTVTVVMTDKEGEMRFEPNSVAVKKGEQIRFVLENKGEVKHEFILASVEDNKKHAEMMKKFPHMEHDEPNSKSLEPGQKAEIFWRFTKSGTFEFACLIPGHYEAGMHGTASVK